MAQASTATVTGVTMTTATSSASGPPFISTTLASTRSRAASSQRTDTFVRDDAGESLDAQALARTRGRSTLDDAVGEEQQRGRRRQGHDRGIAQRVVGQSERRVRRYLDAGRLPVGDDERRRVSEAEHVELARLFVDHRQDTGDERVRRRGLALQHAAQGLDRLREAGAGGRQCLPAGAKRRAESSGIGAVAAHVADDQPDTLSVDLGEVDEIAAQEQTLFTGLVACMEAESGMLERQAREQARFETLVQLRRLALRLLTRTQALDGERVRFGDLRMDDRLIDEQRREHREQVSDQVGRRVDADIQGETRAPRRSTPGWPPP